MKELRADSIRKDYGRRTILSDVYFTLQPGEVAGLLGRNGCGKTTLMQVLFGSVRADQRYLKVNGRVYPREGGITPIAYAPSDPILPHNLTVHQVCLVLAAKERWPALQQEPLFEQFSKRKIKELSVGEEKMILLLAMIHAKAEYVLLDEPFRGLSPVMVEDMQALIRNRAADKGFLIADHDYRSILHFCDSIWYLGDGRLRSVKERQDLVDWGYLSG